MDTLYIIILLSLCASIIAPPVTEKKEKEKEHEENNIETNEIKDDEFAPIEVEYNRYLKEVVQLLESDPQFREKLEKAEEVDIRTGKIAQELSYVSHHVRSKLDELKRQELQRLRQLIIMKQQLQEDGTKTSGVSHDHLDHANPHTFEEADLRKLIEKTTADLAEADKKRHKEFKEYEMQKEYEKQQRLKELDEESREKVEQEYKEYEEKHKKHAPVHHPGSKQQLEEVWEKQDHMENQEFDPKAFFHLHDLDGNGLWDEAEVKALFIKELDKLYKAGVPEDDMRERVEEMERMREHVFSEADTNKDGFLSFQEFLAQTKKPEFEKDQGWETLDQQQLYTQQEYQEFERRRQQQVQQMIQQGLIPPHPAVPQYGYHPGMAVQPHLQHGYAQYPNQVHPGQVHPGQYQHVPQGYGQVPPGQYPQGQVHPGQYQQGQGQFQGQVPPQGQFQQGQVPPQGQFQQGQVPPQGQFQQGQVPPQGQFQQGQVPPQGQFQQGQVPAQGQFQQGQVPPQGQFQQGQVPPQGQFQQGQVPPQGQFQQGQQGQIPSQGFNQNSQPQGHNQGVPQGQGQQLSQNQETQPHSQQANEIKQGNPDSNSVPLIRHPPQPIKNSKEAIDIGHLNAGHGEPQVAQIK